MFYIKALFVMLLCIAAYVAGGLTYDRVAPRVSPWLKRIPFGRLKTDFGKALLVALLCFTAYLSNGRTLPLDMGGDTIPTRLIPFSILRYGEVTVAPVRPYFYVRGRAQWGLSRGRRARLFV